MREGHIYGTTTPITPFEGEGPNEFATSTACLKLMQDAGIKLARTFTPFAFADEAMETETEAYRHALDCVKIYMNHGISTMIAFGSAEQSTVDEFGLVSFVKKYPAWLGDYDSDFYYEVIERYAAKVAADVGDMVTYYQIGNEHDMVLFKGNLTHEQNVRYLAALARGVKSVNPNALCGINLAGSYGGPEEREKAGATGGAEAGETVLGGAGETVLGGVEAGATAGERPLRLSTVHPYAERLIHDLYDTDEHLFDYIGLDGYFGSWGDGGPEDWIPYIDKAYEVSGKPVMINEWGYSTLQRGKPRPEADQHRRFNSDVCRFKDWDRNPAKKWLGKDHSPQMQADYITECLTIFRDHPHCIGNLFFQWQDMAHCWQCGDDDCPAETAWGCIDKYGNPKPGYEAIRKFVSENMT